MKILDRYIANAVIVSTAVSLLVLLGLFAFFVFMDQLGDVGKGDYGVGAAAFYVAMKLPGLLYQLMPMGALLGCISGLGMLAANSELLAVRAAGVSLARIGWSVGKVGLALIGVSMLAGEVVAPVTDPYAQRFRADAMFENISVQGTEGLWARDGLRFINIRDMVEGGRMGNVFIYEMDDSGRLKDLIHARQAFYRPDAWVLVGVEHSRFGPARVVTEHRPQMMWQTQLSPDLLSVVEIKPESLSLWGLYHYIRYLRGNGLDSERYQMVFWGKVLAPLVTAIMVFLSIPFVFGPLRSVGVGARILTGTLTGLSFHLFNQIFNYVGLVYGFNPLVSAVIPTAVFLTVAVLMMRRVH